MSHTNPLYLANAIELLLAASGSKLGAINAGDIPVLYIEANGTRYVMGIRDRPDRLIDGLGDNIDNGAINSLHALDRCRFTSPRIDELRRAFDEWSTGTLDSDDHERIEAAISAVLAHLEPDTQIG